MPVLLGLSVFAYRLNTEYGWDVRRDLSVPVHHGLDAVNGALLAVSPWAVGVANRL